MCPVCRLSDMARPWLRVRALLVLALLLFIHARGWAGEISCPRHSAEHHAVSAHHHGHADHAQDAGKGKPCTCMDDCPACQGVAAVPRTPSLPESPILLTSGAIVAPPWIRLAAPLAHQLPLSTAPPVAG